MTNPVDDGKITQWIAQHGWELFDQLDAGAHVYFCGPKPVLNALEAVAEDRDVVWSEKLKALKVKGQWHVEVY